MFRKLLGVISAVSAVILWFAREYLKNTFWDQVLHMTDPMPAYVLEYGPPAIFVALSIYLLLRNSGDGMGDLTWARSPISLSLERDTESDKIGIQTFPGVWFIQIAVSSMQHIKGCRAWITSSEYDTGGGLFAVELNERLACPWSRHTGGDRHVIDIFPHEPPIRLNVLVFDQNGIRHEESTPTNWLERLQRSGLHRLTISVSGQCNDRGVKKLAHLFVDWNSQEYTATIKMKQL